MTGIVAGLDICPICGAMGEDLCADDDGQSCLDHFGRPADVPRPAAENSAPRHIHLAEVAA